MISFRVDGQPCQPLGGRRDKMQRTSLVLALAAALMAASCAGDASPGPASGPTICVDGMRWQRLAPATYHSYRAAEEYCQAIAGRLPSLEESVALLHRGGCALPAVSCDEAVYIWPWCYERLEAECDTRLVDIAGIDARLPWWPAGVIGRSGSYWTTTEAGTEAHLCVRAATGRVGHCWDWDADVLVRCVFDR